MLTVSWVSLFDNESKAPKPSMQKFGFLGAPGFPGANRRRMTIYYVIITIENAVMYGVWFHYQVSKDINWHAPLKIDGVQRTVDTNALFMILLPCFYVTGLIARGPTKKIFNYYMYFTSKRR